MDHEYNKQYKETYKRIIVLFILFSGVVTYLNYYTSVNRNDFYQKRIAAKAVRQSDWLVHARTFYLSDGHTLDFMLSHEGDYVYMDGKFYIGDSVYKPKNTNLFKVYRLDTAGHYKFFKEYDYNNVN